jgi:hypothetical protein
MIRREFIGLLAGAARLRFFGRSGRGRRATVFAASAC